MTREEIREMLNGKPDDELLIAYVILLQLEQNRKAPA